jgi:hypothetical protein
MGPTMEVQLARLQTIVSYLLYERQEETQLRTAFAALVQERHAHFHADGDKTSEFTDCTNQICEHALKILQSGREQKTVINELSLKLIENFYTKVTITGRECIAELIEKQRLTPVEESMTLPPPTNGGQVII